MIINLKSHTFGFIIYKCNTTFTHNDNGHNHKGVIAMLKSKLFQCLSLETGTQ